ncbi:hypothetical protein LINPERPRIM_LOCUS31518 [Linum perenne]
MSSLWRRLGTNGLVIRWWMKEIGALLFFRILRRSMLQSIHLSHGVVLPDRIKVGASSKSKYCCRKKHAKSQNKFVESGSWVTRIMWVTAATFEICSKPQYDVGSKTIGNTKPSKIGRGSYWGLGYELESRGSSSSS